MMTETAQDPDTEDEDQADGSPDLEAEADGDDGETGTESAPDGGAAEPKLAAKIVPRQSGVQFKP